MGRIAGIKHSKGQSPGAENTLGIDSRIFNVIFALVTGSATFGAGHKPTSKMDVWTYGPGLRFFGDVLFSPHRLNLKRLRRVLS